MSGWRAIRAFALGLAVLVVFASATRAEAWQIVGVGGKCLHARSLTMDSHLALADCRPNLPNQMFTWTSKGEILVGGLTPHLPVGTSPTSGRLCVLFDRRDAQVRLGACDKTGNPPAYLRWGLDRGLIRAMDDAAGRHCLDTHGERAEAGTHIYAWSCHGRQSQRWQWTNNGIVAPFAQAAMPRDPSIIVIDRRYYGAPYSYRHPWHHHRHHGHPHGPKPGAPAAGSPTAGGPTAGPPKPPHATPAAICPTPTMGRSARAPRVTAGRPRARRRVPAQR